MAETDTSEAKHRSPLWMRVLLIASLTLNLAIAGVIAGQTMRMQTKQASVEGLDRRQANLLRLLPVDRRDEARLLMIAENAELLEARVEMAEARKRVIEAIRQEPFAADQLLVALNERVQAFGELNEVRNRQMVMIASKLSAAERQRMTERMERTTRRWEERWAQQ